MYSITVYAECTEIDAKNDCKNQSEKGQERSSIKNENNSKDKK